MRFFLPGTLLALWLLAWGEVSVGNVVSGVALIIVLFLSFPTARHSGERVRVHPIAMARLVGYVLVQLAVSNVLVAREILTRRSRVSTGVIGHRIRQPSDLTLTIMSNIIALAPGTMPVDVTHDPPMIYVHFLLLSNVEDARRTIGRLEKLVVAAVGTRSTTNTHDAENRGELQ